MGKQAEIEYMDRIHPSGVRDAMNKPYSGPDCGRHFVDLGTIITLMPQPPARILDMGCGTGWTSLIYARHGYEVVGQDLAPRMIELANQCKARDGLTNASFVVSDYEGLGFQDEFDVVVFYDCLHHAIDERAALKSAYEALKPGGRCITIEPGEGHGEHPNSLEAVRLYGVTEKDMPPHHILKLGEELGFCRREVYNRGFPLQIVHATGTNYEPYADVLDDEPVPLPGQPTPVEPPPSLLRRILRWGKNVLRKLLGKTVPIVPVEPLIPVGLRRTNIVVLTK